MKTPPKVTEYVDSIVSLLEEQGERALLPEIAAALQARVQQEQLAARVISAVSLTDEQQLKIKAVLTDETVEFTVDPGIIGGLVVEQGGRRLDLSLKRTLS